MKNVKNPFVCGRDHIIYPRSPHVSTLEIGVLLPDDTGDVYIQPVLECDASVVPQSGDAYEISNIIKSGMPVSEHSTIIMPSNNMDLVEGAIKDAQNMLNSHEYLKNKDTFEHEE